MDIKQYWKNFWNFIPLILLGINLIIAIISWANSQNAGLMGI